MWRISRRTFGDPIVIWGVLLNQKRWHSDLKTDYPVHHGMHGRSHGVLQRLWRLLAESACTEQTGDVNSWLHI